MCAVVPKTQEAEAVGALETRSSSPRGKTLSLKTSVCMCACARACVRIGLCWILGISSALFFQVFAGIKS
jgi:hypothetical protein